MTDFCCIRIIVFIPWLRLLASETHRVALYGASLLLIQGIDLPYACVFISHVQINHKCSLRGLSNSRLVAQPVEARSLSVFSEVVPHKQSINANCANQNLFIYNCTCKRVKNITVCIAAKVNLPLCQGTIEKFS